jgi:hypothetical protein
MCLKINVMTTLENKNICMYLNFIFYVTFVMYLFPQPIQLLNVTLDLTKAGKLPAGRTEIPFEVPLKPKVNKVLYETFHGVFVNIQVCFSLI